MLRRIAMLMVVGGLATSTGCVLLRPVSPLQPTTAPEALAAEDIPVPADFVLDLEESRRHVRDGYRELDLTYRRCEYISEQRVVEFFLQHMPRHGWSTEFVYGLDEQKIDFSREGEECTVVVEQRVGDRLTEFRLTVNPAKTTSGEFVAARSRPPGTGVKASESDPKQGDASFK